MSTFGWGREQLRLCPLTSLNGRIDKIHVSSNCTVNINVHVHEEFVFVKSIKSNQGHFP